MNYSFKAQRHNKIIWLPHAEKILIGKFTSNSTIRTIISSWRILRKTTDLAQICYSRSLTSSIFISFPCDEMNFGTCIYLMPFCLHVKRRSHLDIFKGSTCLIIYNKCLNSCAIGHHRHKTE